MLTERIAICLWKMRRIDHFQNIATVSNMSRAYADLQVAEAYSQGTLGKGGKYPEIPEDKVLLAEALRVLPTPADLDKIMRYEAHLHRLCTQALHELEALQIRRKGGTSPLTRFDITGPPVG
jgi:hypothetical protein